MQKRELADKIRTLRKDAGLRQEDLAAKAGVSIRVIKDIEAASGNPTLDSLRLILEVLGTSFQDLFSVKNQDDGGPNKKTSHQHSSGDEVSNGHKRDSNDWANNEFNPKGLNPGADQQINRKVTENIGSIKGPKVSGHPPSSAPNKESFSPDRATLILAIQSRLTPMNERELRLVDGFIEDLLAHRSASSGSDSGVG